jgi:RNA polymerase sigma-70 factor (ECF subfamily)
MSMPAEKQASPPAHTRADPEDWVDRYGDYLFRYAMSRLRDRNAAEEVVQETFLAGVRHFQQYSGRGTQQGWLLGILKRKIIDFVRRRVRDNRAAPYEDAHDPTTQLFDAMGNWKQGAIKWSPAPEQRVESEEFQLVVQQCLETLPRGQADVFVLSVIEEMDSQEICRELDITPSNFWVRMHRARLGLARCVGSKWFDNDGSMNHGG